MYDRLSELSLSIGRDQNGLAWRESMEGANCGLHPLIHTLPGITLAQDLEKKKAEPKLRSSLKNESPRTLVVASIF